MKRLLLTNILLFLSCILPCAGAYAQDDMGSNKRDRAIIMYQIDISRQATEHIQDIFDRFNNSYVDYESAISQTSVLINEYNKAMQVMPSPLPKDSEKLHTLMKKLLAQVERYFMCYKRFGREDPAINEEIYRTRYEIMREASMLQQAYL